MWSPPANDGEQKLCEPLPGGSCWNSPGCSMIYFLSLLPGVQTPDAVCSVRRGHGTRTVWRRPQQTPRTQKVIVVVNHWYSEIVVFSFSPVVQVSLCWWADRLHCLLGVSAKPVGNENFDSIPQHLSHTYPLLTWRMTSSICDINSFPVASGKCKVDTVKLLLQY